MDVAQKSSPLPSTSAPNTLAPRADQVWTRDEWILALSLYLDRRDGRVTDLDQAYRDLGGRLGRSPGSIPVRLFDFEAQDPANAGKKPMAAPGAIAKAVWAEFASDPAAARTEASEAQKRLASLGIAGNPQPRIWKISPGESAEFWEDCCREGYIVVGWNELGDLSRFVGGDREEFLAEYRKAYQGAKERSITVKSGALWTFLNEVKPGDVVVANRGKSVVVGRGEVLGSYQYRTEREKYRHALPVRWFDVEERAVGDQGGGWMKTLNPVSEAKYAALLNGPPASTVSKTTMSQGRSPGVVEAVQARLDESGLHFSQELISAYLLALQAKRFVILTGISGTGKTHLALTLAKAFPITRTVFEATNVPESAFVLPKHAYMAKNRRIHIPAALRPYLVKADGELAKVIRVLEGTKVHEVALWSAKDRPISQALFRKSSADMFERLRSYSKFALEPVESADEMPTLRIHFPSETSRAEPINNVEIVAVRPDWTDGRGLLGYWNPIAEEYVRTPALRLLQRAIEEATNAEKEKRPAAPFFLILDEMNLARVEHYFAEFLSALESSKPIDLHDSDEAAGEDEGESDGDRGPWIPKRLALPANLFITGTVNIDETTHMFSPKVLDRAFVLELNDVDLTFLDSGSTGGLRLTTAPEVLQLDPRNREAWDDFGELVEGEVRNTLLALHHALEAYGRHFAYRVAFDVARFVVLADEQGDGSAEMAWSALDEAVLAKVLPKLAGTQGELERPLADLLVICTGTGSEPALPKSARKLARMQQRLSQVGYCSFLG